LNFFEIKSHDLAARITKLKTNHGTITTPTILPVINPKAQVIPASEMKEFGVEAVITNAYILWKDLREEALDKGVHDLIGFNGPVMTDSGAYQLMEYGEISVSNREVIDFQKKIGVDVGVILDVPTSSSDEEAVKASVAETITRAKEAKQWADDSLLWAGPVQGGTNLKLLKKSAMVMDSLGYDILPIGSVVPLLVKYDFASVVRMIKTVRETTEKPLHLFGAGHPMFFSFAVALGIDLFDSAAYALYAKEGRYLTPLGTKHLSELKELPCSCPVCSNTPLKEMDEEKLARHNLFVTMQEIRTVRQAIREGELFDLLCQRAASHPSLYKAMKQLVKYKDFFDKRDPITKKHFFYSSEFSKHRVEVIRVKERLSRIKSKQKQDIGLFKQVPITLTECYPFTQYVDGEERKLKKAPNGFEKIRDASLYWFGVNLFKPTDTVKVSRSTGKIRAVYRKGELLAVFRASDFMIMLHAASRDLHEKTRPPEHRVIVRKDVAEFIKQGKSVFAKHVINCGNIVPGQQVLVVTEDDELLASGDALLNSSEMLAMKKGPAVSVRWHA